MYKLALLLLKRQWHSGALRILSLALIIGVAGLSTVTFFTDRIQQAIVQQSATFLGADSVITRSRPIPEPWIAQAEQQHLQTALTTELLSVATTTDNATLTEIKAVTPAYPLKGNVRISEIAFGPDNITTNIPAPGEVWLENRLLSSLNVDVGQRISVGDATFVISAVITYEPDRGANIVNAAPRILMNGADLDATQLIQPGSRVSYHLLIAGDPDNLRSFEAWVTPELQSSDRFNNLENSRPSLQRAMDHSGRYLNLSALISLILAGIAIAICAQKYSQQQFDTCALLRAFGATTKQTLWLYASILLCLGFIASILGVILGYMAQFGLTRLLQEAFSDSLPAPSIYPIALGLSAGLIILVGFAFPPLLRLSQVPPISVLQHIPLPTPKLTQYLYVGALIATFLLMLSASRDFNLSLWLFIIILLTLSTLCAGAFVLIKFTALMREHVPMSLRFAINELSRHTRTHIIQIVATGLAIALLLIISIVRSDLAEQWENQIPDDASNQFAFNINPSEVDNVADFFKVHQLEAKDLYPMIRARIIEINDETISANDYPENEMPRLLQRELNITWRDTLPEKNEIVSGQWWQSEREYPQISVEKRVYEQLDLKLGDTLTFATADQTITAVIQNLREVNWDDLQPNFFVIFEPGAIEQFPTTYLTSFYVEPTDKSILNTFASRFPTVTVIDIDAILTQVKALLGQASLAIYYMFVFCILATFMVLFAANFVSMSSRLRESAVMRALGAQRNQIMRYQIIESLLSGSLAGLIGAMAASIGGHLIAVSLFDLSPPFNPWLWLIGLVLGALFQMIVGIIRLRTLLKQSPVQALASM